MWLSRSCNTVAAPSNFVHSLIKILIFVQRKACSIINNVLQMCFLFLHYQTSLPCEKSRAIRSQWAETMGVHSSRLPLRSQSQEWPEPALEIPWDKSGVAQAPLLWIQWLWIPSGCKDGSAETPEAEAYTWSNKRFPMSPLLLNVLFSIFCVMWKKRDFHAISATTRLTIHPIFGSMPGMSITISEFHVLVPNSRCDFSTNLKATLSVHLKRHHPDPLVRSSFPCTFCQHRASTRGSLKSHIDARHNPNRVKNFPCALCPKAYYVRSTLNLHVKEAHLKEKGYKCDKCSFATFSRDRLKRHVRRMHDDEGAFTGSRFTCNICGFHALTKAGLSNHVRRGHPKERGIKRLDGLSKMEEGSYHLKVLFVRLRRIHVEIVQ